jgi:transcriptional regulator with XRE-family HTH domain
MDATESLGKTMITAAQLRAARALLGIDQRRLADLCGLSLPTIQRMEASGDVIRGNVDSLMKLIDALETSGVELINDGGVSQGGGRGVRLKTSAKNSAIRPGKDSPGPQAA